MRVRLFAPLALAGLVYASAAPAAEAEALKIGDAAPGFVLRTVNPKLSKLNSFALKDFAGPEAKSGKRAVVLSFAASYCEPCKKELAELKGMRAELEGAGVLLAVVVIDTDAEGIAAMTKLTVDDLALPYPVLSDRFGVLARRYHANTLPMTVVINADGTVRWISSGFADGALDRLREQLAIKK